MTAVSADAGSSRGVRKVRKIPRPVEKLLWARAAGRCECGGCNEPLWKSLVSQESVPVGQNAHIYAFSEGGARGNEPIADDQIHDPSNLILACYPCHRRIDKDKAGEKYSAALLQSWKAAHEARIERVTGIDPAMRSHVLFYGANTGAHAPPLFAWREVVGALFPDRYPAEDRAIELGLKNSASRDDGHRYWGLELENLRAQFERRVRVRLGGADGIGHVSLFALAPQPLLIALGGLLGDIVPADVYQRRREPPGWYFDGENEKSGWPGLTVEAPDDPVGKPVLVLSVSASVSDDRLASAIDGQLAVWRLTVPEPDNDVVVRRSQLRAFRTLMKQTLDQVKLVHGQDTRLHVVPVMPVSTAVELGRLRMPKAEMPWRLYDQLPQQGFVPVVDMHGDDFVAVGGEA